MKRQWLYLGLGSSLGNREATLDAALLAITGQIGRVDAVSPKYETEAWGFTSEDRFLNLAAKVMTRLKPEEVLRECLAIEASFGRTMDRAKAYASRTLDIDILFYGSQVIATPELTVPHPNIEFRRFVLEPLAAIAPGLTHPVLHKSVAELLTECTDKLSVRIYHDDAATQESL